MLKFPKENSLDLVLPASTWDQIEEEEEVSKEEEDLMIVEVGEVVEDLEGIDMEAVIGMEGIDLVEEEEEEETEEGMMTTETEEE